MGLQHEEGGCCARARTAVFQQDVCVRDTPCALPAARLTSCAGWRDVTVAPGVMRDRKAFGHVRLRYLKYESCSKGMCCWVRSGWQIGAARIIQAPALFAGVRAAAGTAPEDPWQVRLVFLMKRMFSRT